MNMKVLILCNKPPYPPREGGPIAMHAIIAGLLHSDIKVKVLSVNSNKYSTKLEEIPTEYKAKTGIELVDVDLSVTIAGALKNLLKNRSYSIERFKSKEFENKLIDILKNEEFDIIQIELIHLSPYIETIRKNSKAKIVLRAHNVEHLIWERIVKNERNPFKKLYIKHVAATLKQYELNILSKYDAILAITEKDASFFRRHTDKPVVVIPFGVTKSDLEKCADNDNSSTHKSPIRIKSNSTLFHLGSMDYQPNIEGIDWFLKNIWDEVKTRRPDAKLVLAGRNMPDELWKLNGSKGIEIVGEIEDAKKFMQENGTMVVPLLSGSGIRIKIIEGMSLGKPIISTSIGAEGINYEDGKNILIADSVEKFIEICMSCFDQDMYSEIGIAAMRLIENDHDNISISKKLINLYQSITNEQK